jgi:hypothetical protein
MQAWTHKKRVMPAQESGLHVDSCAGYDMPAAERSPLVETRSTWPYAAPVICCALPDRPFELMSESECTGIGGTPFVWPTWEAEYGCVRCGAG